MAHHFQQWAEARAGDRRGNTFAPAPGRFAWLPWASVPAGSAMLEIQASHTGSKVFSTIFLAPPDDDPIRFAGIKLGA